MKIHPIPRHDLFIAQGVLLTAILLQLLIWAINPQFTYGPHNLIVVTEALLVVCLGLTIGNGESRRHPVYRSLTLVLLGLISLENISSFLLVANLLISGVQDLSGKELLVAALAIFITNIIIFSLWYWEIDSPGFSGKRWSKYDKDFQFTQYDLGHEYAGWQAGYPDYLYLSLTNAINFAPADARPLTQQAKMLMGTQALISVFTLALILARSISILH
jgi:hypothetical protein